MENKVDNIKFKHVISAIIIFIFLVIFNNSKKAYASEYFDIEMYDSNGTYQFTASINLNEYPLTDYIYVIDTNECHLANLKIFNKLDSVTNPEAYTENLVKVNHRLYTKSEQTGKDTVGAICINAKSTEEVIVTETGTFYNAGDIFITKTLDTRYWENGKTLDTRTMRIVGQEYEEEYDFKISDIPEDWQRVGNLRYPEYLVIKKDGYYYFVVSAGKYYSDITTQYIHKGNAYTRIYRGYVVNDSIDWVYIYDDKTSYTKLLDGIVAENILYNSDNIMDTDVWPDNKKTTEVNTNTTNTIVIEKNEIGGATIYDKTYQYNSNIPKINVTGITSDKILLIDSRTKKNINWKPNNNNTYEIEIKVLLEERHLPWQDNIDLNTFYETVQTVRGAKAWFYRIVSSKTSGNIKDSDGTFKFDVSKSREAIKYMTEQAGLEEEYYIKEIYMRYVKVNDLTLDYGDYTLIRLKYDTGYVEIREFEILETYETTYIDPETQEEENITMPLESTKQEGSSLGTENPNIIDLDKDGQALENATKTIEEVGGWLGQLPVLIGNLFMFLPPEILTLIGLGITLVIILRIAGR